MARFASSAVTLRRLPSLRTSARVLEASLLRHTPDYTAVIAFEYRASSCFTSPLNYSLLPVSLRRLELRVFTPRGTSGRDQ